MKKPHLHAGGDEVVGRKVATVVRTHDRVGARASQVTIEYSIWLW
jgi:hypothetical protein